MLRRDVPIDRRPRRRWRGARRTWPRCSGCSTSSSSARSSSGSTRCSRPRSRPPRPRGGERARGRGGRGSASAAEAAPCAGRPARRWTWPPAWTGATRSLARSTGAGRRARRRPRRGGLGAGPVARTIRPVARGARRRPAGAAAHQAKALMRGAGRRSASTCGRSCSTRPSPRTCIDPAETRYEHRRPARPLHRRLAPRRGRRPRASSTSTATAPTRRVVAGAARRWPSSRLAPAARGRPRQAGHAHALRRDREPARRACWPGWRRSASASTPSSCAACNDRLTSECHAARGRGVRRRRAGVQRQLAHRSCARSCSTSAGCRRRRRPRPGFSTDAAVAGEAARTSGPSSSTRCCATARSRSCARPTARACWPRSRADGRIHATFNQTVARTGRLVVGPAQPAQHPGALRGGAPVPHARSCRRPGTCCSSPTTTRSSCAASPTSPRTRVSSPPSPSGQDIHTATASRIFGVEPSAVTIEQRSKAKMVSYGLAYGMEAYGLGQRLNIPTEEAAEILDGVLRGLPEREGVHGPHGDRGPQAGLHRDAVRAPPAHPGAAVVELAHPPGGGAPGHERRHPGPGRRHLQGGAGAARRGAGGRRHRRPARAAGARRGAGRGAPRATRTPSASSPTAR